VDNHRLDSSGAVGPTDKPAAHKSPFIWPYWSALRPHQWTKNMLVFAAPLFGFSMDAQTLLGSLLAFGLFCATSSSFYLINDILDVESDRRHPVKCNRPIAAGLVSVPVAIVMAVILMAGALILGWLKTPGLGLTLLSYVGLQIAYNLKLKQTPILDVIAISMGFIFRAIAGGVVNGIVLSPWFLLCTAMMSLFLAIEKRKAELHLSKRGIGSPRKVLKHYSLSVLNRMESTVTTSTVISYALWSSGPVVNGASTSWMLLTLPFVLYGIFRYQLLSEPNTAPKGAPALLSERPEEVLLKDRPILLTVSTWIATVFAVLWLKSQGYIS
jgi:decaprenyl-phosphate phosphoribosyltransferase